MTSRDIHRVRSSHYDRIDQEAASRIMTREWRGGIRRRVVPADDRTGQALAAFASASAEHARPEGATWADRAPEVVRAALERSRLIPLALLDPCPAGHAPAGARCYPPGVCGARLRRAVEARALASA